MLGIYVSQVRIDPPNFMLGEGTNRNQQPSGGHLNPAVTVMNSIFRSFAWKKVPHYIIAQILGAFCGAGIVYGKSSHLVVTFGDRES